MVCKGLESQNALGIILDEDRNARGSSRLCAIHHDTSLVKVLVVPTNEEYEIAQETLQVIKNTNRL